MTTLTTVLGLLPLVVFPGAGSELYRGLGTVMLSGLLISTVFTLFFVPLLFSLFHEAQLAAAGRLQTMGQALAARRQPPGVENTSATNPDRLRAEPSPAAWQPEPVWQTAISPSGQAEEPGAASGIEAGAEAGDPSPISGESVDRNAG
jgi:hypothetical protein